MLIIPNKFLIKHKSGKFLKTMYSAVKIETKNVSISYRFDGEFLPCSIHAYLFLHHRMKRDADVSHANIAVVS